MAKRVRVERRPSPRRPGEPAPDPAPVRNSPSRRLLTDSDRLIGEIDEALRRR